MVTGFMTKWTSTYYFDENGAQVSGRVYEVEGEKYTFDENGVLIN
jgi:glucan-binding YG repeat protein